MKAFSEQYAQISADMFQSTADKDARYQDIITVISCLHGNNIENFYLAVMSN